MPNLNELYLGGDVEGLLSMLYEGVEDLQKADVALEHGPLKKSPETFELELLFRHIVSGHEVEITSTGDPLEYIAILRHEGITRHFNVSNLLKHANLNHITPSDTETADYLVYTRNTSIIKPQKAPETGTGYPDEQYFTDRDENHELDDLTYAEKIAINIYTTEFYREMNALLRGRVSPINSPNDQNQVKEALIHSIMSASGLNKIS